MFKHKQQKAIIAVSCMMVLGLAQLGYAQTERHIQVATNPSGASTTDVMYQFNSNDYTRPEPVDAKVPPTAVPAGYEKVTETDQLALYLSKSTLGVAVQDNRSGYVWTSVPSPSELKKEQLNSDWLGAVESPIVVNYFGPDGASHSGSLGTLGGQVEDVQPIQNGIQAVVNFTAIDVSITMQVKLSGDGLVVRVPNSGIVERGDQKLSSLRIYPFFGAVHDADVPGYMFIPDGSGALIRYAKQHPYYDQPFTGTIYGNDVSIDQQTSSDSASIGTALPPKQIYMPVFGMVHGAGRNAVLGVVESGQYDANIVAYPSGVTTDLNWVTPEFNLRHSYFQPTSASLDGFNTFQKARGQEDIQVRYQMLTGQAANYTGMANAYRQYLAEHGRLVKNIHPTDKTPIRIDLLGEETKPGLFGSGTVTMTTFKQAESIASQLVKNKVNNIQLVYKGWNAGGLTAANPDFTHVAGALGGASGLTQLRQDLLRLGVPLYLYSDFSKAYKSSNGFHSKTQAVRDVTNRIVKESAVNELEQMNSNRLSNLYLYYMNPGVAKNIAESSAGTWKGWGMQGAAIDSTGSTLFSDFNSSHSFTREQAVNTYRGLAADTLGQVGSLSMYTPNDYMLQFASSAYDMPLGSSQYMYESDTVPFLETVLHGMVNCFAPYSNFNADGREQVLRMIDYGTYPSFFITNDPSWKLQDTPSETLFTSRFGDWSSDIQGEYQAVNNALKQVQNASLQARNVPDWGLVEDVYSNGYRVLINYRSQDATIDGVKLPALGYVVQKGGSQR